MAVATTYTGKNIASATNAESYAFATSYTPGAAGELLVIAVRITASVAAITVTDVGQGLTWTAHHSSTAGSNKLAILSAVTASTTALTPTIACTGDAGTGCDAILWSVTGADTTTPAKQAAVIGTGASGSAPAITFGAACTTTSAVLVAAHNATNPAALTEPSTFTEDLDTGHDAPVAGAEYAHKDTGFTGTTVTWGSNSASNWQAQGIEIAASAATITMTLGMTIGF